MEQLSVISYGSYKLQVASCKIKKACRLLATCNLQLVTFFLSPLFLLPSPAHAACTNPAGVAGEIVYNTTHDVLQYCNAADQWIAMGSSGGGGGGGAADNLGDHTATQALNMDNNSITGASVVSIGDSNGNELLNLGDATNPSIFIGVPGSNDRTLMIGYNSSTNYGFMYGGEWGGTPRALSFGVGSTPVLRIDTDGEVGIGTTDPQYKLHVTGTGVMGLFDGTNSDVRVDIKNDARRFGVKVRDIGTGDDTLIISDETASSERISLDSAGNVGVGTNNPAHKLHVVGNVHATGNITCDGTCGGEGIGSVTFHTPGTSDTNLGAKKFCAISTYYPGDAYMDMTYQRCTTWVSSGTWYARRGLYSTCTIVCFN